MRPKEYKYSRGQSFSIVVVAYIISLLIGYWTLSLFHQQELLVQLFLADTFATIAIFIFSVVYRNSSMYDPYWSVIPPFIAVFWIWNAPDEGNVYRQVILVILICIWGIRLTANWARSWEGLGHEDWRYGQIASKTGKLYWVVSFLGIHFFPTVMVYLGCLPLAYTMKSTAPIGLWDLMAILVTLSAIGIETVADEQLKTFKKSGKSGLMKSGLWAFSRHPNYFGEITFWLGIFLFVFATGNQESWWTVLGFITMLLLFVFISVPMMDRRHLEKRPEYAQYMKRVSALIPLPPKA